MKKIIKIAAITISIFVIVSCSKEEVKPLLDQYDLKETSLYPEGIYYSNLTQLTYVGSYYKGKIVTVDLDGNMTDFIIDNTLVAAVGIAVNESKNRLYVCNSDAGISERSSASTTGILAQINVYDLMTGSKIKTIDLSGLYQGGHFLNDIVIDPSGNLYVTDSFSPVIYKIDSNDNASVFSIDTKFAAPQGTFGLNGIAYHTDGFLIVGKSYGGLIYKVPLNNPSIVTNIALDKNVNSLDGILLTDDNTLMLVSNYFAGPIFDEAVYKIESSNGWTSANITNSFKSFNGKFPTTLTEINNGLFVSFGYFPDLVDPNSLPNNNFKLQKIKL